MPRLPCYHHRLDDGKREERGDGSIPAVARAGVERPILWTQHGAKHLGCQNIEARPRTDLLAQARHAAIVVFDTDAQPCTLAARARAMMASTTSDLASA